MSILNKVERAVKEHVSRSEQSVAHRMDHLRRVLRNAQIISASYAKVDNEVLSLAVLLHDVEQPHDKKADHVKLSVAAAGDILEAAGVPQSTRTRVLAAISEHSTELIERRQPTSLEARILFDADKIDGLGPTGIARVFALFGQMGKPPVEAVSWYRQKIEKSKQNLQTPEGRRLFHERLAYVESFLDEMEQENLLLEEKNLL